MFFFFFARQPRSMLHASSSSSSDWTSLAQPTPLHLIAPTNFSTTNSHQPSAITIPPSRSHRYHYYHLQSTIHLQSHDHHDHRLFCRFSHFCHSSLDPHHHPCHRAVSRPPPPSLPPRPPPPPPPRSPIFALFCMLNTAPWTVLGLANARFTSRRSSISLHY